MKDFAFLNPGVLVDGDVELILVETVPGDPEKNWVPVYRFDMRVDGKTVGRIALRAGNTHRLVMYGGHIGYEVAPEHRGHRYAVRSCRLILPLAGKHGLNPVWITCNPDNIASRRTCERAGATYVETVDLPKDIDMYQEGERQKCRYRIDL